MTPNVYREETGTPLHVLRIYVHDPATHTDVPYDLPCTVDVCPACHGGKVISRSVCHACDGRGYTKLVDQDSLTPQQRAVYRPLQQTEVLDEVSEYLAYLKASGV